MRDLINILMACAGSIVGFLFGGLDGLIITLVVFIIVDYITGVLDAIINKKLSSAVGFVGIIRKILILLIVSVGHFVDAYLLGGGSVIRDACIFFYISNEGISILENVVEMGVPVPEKLVRILEQLEDKENGDDETDEDLY